MDGSAHRSPARVARRVATRTLQYLRRDPVLLLALAGLIGLLALGVPNALTPAEASSVGRDGAEQYMQALRDRDAELFYQSLGPTMRRQLESGVGVQGPGAVTALFRFQEQQGDRILDYKLVGSYETQQGGSLRFYVARARTGNQQVEVPYVITLDRDGKVVNVD